MCVNFFCLCYHENNGTRVVVWPRTGLRFLWQEISSAVTYSLPWSQRRYTLIVSRSEKFREGRDNTRPGLPGPNVCPPGVPAILRYNNNVPFAVNFMKARHNVGTQGQIRSYQGGSAIKSADVSNNRNTGVRAYLLETICSSVESGNLLKGYFCV